LLERINSILQAALSSTQDGKRPDDGATPLQLAERLANAKAGLEAAMAAAVADHAVALQDQRTQQAAALKAVTTSLEQQQAATQQLAADLEAAQSAHANTERYALRISNCPGRC